MKLKRFCHKQYETKTSSAIRGYMYKEFRPNPEIDKRIIFKKKIENISCIIKMYTNFCIIKGRM